MVDVPDSLLCLFTAPLEEREDSVVFEIPRKEVELETLAAGETYRVAVAPAPASADAADGRDQDATEQSAPEPPVEVGEVRAVEIESIGDQGDGIAKVERGYVVIVPDTERGDEVTVEVEKVLENVAFARVRHNSTGSQPDLDDADGLAYQPSLGEDIE
jgi:predicted RNA-binding protein with TRAM domain